MLSFSDMSEDGTEALLEETEAESQVVVYPVVLYYQGSHAS